MNDIVLIVMFIVCVVIFYAVLIWGIISLVKWIKKVKTEQPEKYNKTIYEIGNTIVEVASVINSFIPEQKDKNCNYSDYEPDENKSYDRSFCHYQEDKISTIYDNGTVIRSDGVGGFINGDYIHYSDGTTKHIVMLNDEDGFIE